MIPRIIWTYWDTSEIPSYIQDCINTWKKHCKNDWYIIITNRDTIKLFLEENIDYPKNIWLDIPAHQSDMFGVSLINKYGGIWMDANIIMLSSIDFIIEKEWFGYYYKDDNLCNNGIAEVFLFASEKNSYTINKIHSLFFKIFSSKNTERQNILKNEYNINESYLYPQYLINYLINNDNTIKDVIVNNCHNQWTTIYSLIQYLHFSKNMRYKNQIIELLSKIEDSIPENILKQPLLKLQGSLLQKNYIVNSNSWWYKLTN